MSHLIKTFPISSVLIILTTLTLISKAANNATTFDIKNNCNYTVWAAALPGGGKQLNTGETWTISVNPTQHPANGSRIWARTGCTITSPNGLKCQTGDCGGLLECTTLGSPPNTLVEYALGQLNNNMDLFDISLLEGFNVPVSFMASPNKGCNRKISCGNDLNGQCPKELRAPGGCNSPCNVFETEQYCCNSGSCSPTNYSQYFKQGCPDAVSLPDPDGPASTDVCPTGTNYVVTFCP